jgi:hypothetical protein
VGLALKGFLKTRWWIAAVLLIEAALLPWTGHAYDLSAFLSHAEFVYFGHVSPTALWPFGSISLAALLLSQLPILFFPQLWSALPLRILFLKLPAWCADIGSAAVVRACSSSSQDANFWALRYLMDPAVVFVTVFHGQGDALPNFFAVAGIALTLAQRFELAGLAFGLGAGTKFFPAAFVPLLIVTAYRCASWRRALLALSSFGVAAAVTLLPVLWGRADLVLAAYQNNSFGPESGGVSIASLWALLPRGAAIAPLPQLEQFVAVAVPVFLALGELRHVPDRRDVARAAMLTAMSIVLLNPGAHPPFYLWIAGPLVLYAAVADDGLVSLGGLVLSCVSVLTQFCQEGSDEYFRLSFGPGPDLGLLRCVAPPAAFAGIALVAASFVIVAAYRRELLSQRSASLWRRVACVASFAVFAAFSVAIAIEAASAAATHSMLTGYREEERLVNTFSVDPSVKQLDGHCSLTYAANDVIVYAGNEFAARFATASLGYRLFSPEKMTIRGRAIPVESFPSTFENIDVRTVGQQRVRITREFDVTSLLRPFRFVERFVERPCNLIRENPLLIYRFDFAAARAAAARLPLLRRLNIFTRGGS